MKNDPVESALAGLDEIQAGTPGARKQLAQALAAKSNLVAAKTARIIGDAQLTDLAGDLASAFERFLKKASADKCCAALTAIARALVKLDYDDAELFRRGLKHVQREPVWGGTEDTAAELRSVCATGLANSRDPHKLRPPAELLTDSEWPARAGAVRAIATVGSEAASVLLRFKALTGDREPEVISECVTGLLDVDGADALPLAASLAASPQPEVREASILALGASRRADAIEFLKERFGATADRDTRKCILLALASSRTEAALEFLLDLIRDGSASTAELAYSAMSIHRADPGLHEAVEKAAAGRSDGTLSTDGSHRSASS
jgi:HEAT repeat protein